MKLVKSLLTLLLCAAVCFANSDVDAEDALVRSTNLFSFKLFKKLVNEYKNENLLISPLSAYLALALTSEGTAGTTYDQVHDILRLPEKSISKSAFQKLINEFNVQDDKVTVSLANKVLVTDTLTVKPEFEKNIKDKFNSSVFKFNSHNVQKTLDEVNRWANESTNGKISKLVTEDDLKVKMLLLNAVYFKSAWKQIFIEKYTFPRPFNTENGLKSVETMFKEGFFHSGDLEKLKARFIELPYEANEYKMTILLPHKSSNVDEVLKNLNPSTLQDIEQSRKSSRVKLYLPKFKIKSALNLKNVFAKLGLTYIFNSDEANFDNLTSGQDLYVGSVKQDAFIDVNEKGSEAAAITKIGIMAKSSSGALSNEFKVDRPSVFFITKKNSVVFAGILRDPVY